MDGERVYEVAEVIKTRLSTVNEDCEDENQNDEVDADTRKHDSTLSKSVSRIMIEQFFTEIEGPELDWQKEDYDVFEKTQELITTAS